MPKVIIYDDNVGVRTRQFIDVEEWLSACNISTAVQTAHNARI